MKHKKFWFPLIGWMKYDGELYFYVWFGYWSCSYNWTQKKWMKEDEE